MVTNKQEKPLEHDKDVEKGAAKNDADTTSPNESKKVLKYIGIAAIVILVGAVALAVGLTVDSGSTTPVNDDSSSEGGGVYTSRKAAPFNVTLRLFDSQITSGYQNEMEFEQDMENAAKFLLNNILQRDFVNHNGPVNEVLEDSPAAPEMSLAAPAAGADGASRIGDDVTEYGQNNQESGVEEGDSMVSDGNWVFAGFGSKIAIWDPKTGDRVADIEMPEIEYVDPFAGEEGYPKPQPLPVDGEPEADDLEVLPTQEDTEDPPAGGEQEGSTEDDEAALPLTAQSRSSFIGGPGYGWEPKPSVRHLLVQGDRLVAFVEGYGIEFRNAMKNETGEWPILQDYMGTHIRVYQIVSAEDGALELLSETHVNGYFVDVRAIGSSVHVVTSSGIDTYSRLVYPFEPYRFPEMNRDEYIEYVTKAAEEKSIPEFTSQLVTELKESTGAMPNLFRLALMQSESSGTGLEEVVFSNGIVNSLAQVFSLDMMQPYDGNSGDNSLELSVSGSFMSSWGSRVYATVDTMVLAGDGWEYDVETGASHQSTHLLGIQLDGATSSPASIGTVEGYFLNEHSLDVLDGVLRIATTVRNWDSWIRLPEVDPELEDETSEEPTSTSEATDEQPPPAEEESEASRTQNYIITLDLSAPDRVMNELDRIQLGKPNEVFTAVRYFDNVAYAVTYEQRDPLYVLDLSDPSDLVAVSELDISGFSSYLHSLNPPNNSLLLAIGQESDDEANIIGFQITVFDMRDPQDPKVAQRLVVEDDPDSYSGSASEWDFMATRVVEGRLIIPLEIHNWKDESKSFSGFAVFVVNENEIREECRVKHKQWTSMTMDTTTTEDEETNGMTEYCYYCGPSLPQRSMVFNGDLMTAKGSTVMSTDMGTCAGVWDLDVAEGGDDNICCGMYWF